VRSSSIQQSHLSRWPAFTTGAFLGFLFGVILGLSSCQSAECQGSTVGQQSGVGGVSLHLL
jgi:hypothetical protein